MERRCGCSPAGTPRSATFLPGVWPRRARVGHCGQVGGALAGLHLAGADYAPSGMNALGSHGWRTLLGRCRTRADEVQPNLAAELDAALTEISIALAHRAAGGTHPRGPVSRQRVLPGRAFVRNHRFLLRGYGCSGLRRRGLPERLVFRGGLFVQRHQGTGDVALLRNDAPVVPGRAGGSARVMPRRGNAFPADPVV